MNNTPSPEAGALLTLDEAADVIARNHEISALGAEADSTLHREGADEMKDALTVIADTVPMGELLALITRHLYRAPSDPKVAGLVERLQGAICYASTNREWPNNLLSEAAHALAAMQARVDEFDRALDDAISREHDFAGAANREKTRAEAAERERDAALAERDEARGYAERLATALHAKHYPEVTDWKPLEDLTGLLSQIDNMTAGLPSDNGALFRLRKDYERTTFALVEAQEKHETAERQLTEAREAWREARKTLPPDPSMNAPWSQCIAIMDESLSRNAVAPGDGEAGRADPAREDDFTTTRPESTAHEGGETGEI